MIAEHEYVVVVRDLPEVSLVAGDAGVVIHIHRRADTGEIVGYLLELATVDGRSVDEVSAPADGVRPASGNDRLAARQVAAE